MSSNKVGLLKSIHTDKCDTSTASEQHYQCSNMAQSSDYGYKNHPKDMKLLRCVSENDINSEDVLQKIPLHKQNSAQTNLCNKNERSSSIVIKEDSENFPSGYCLFTNRHQEVLREDQMDGCKMHQLNLPKIDETAQIDESSLIESSQCATQFHIRHNLGQNRMSRYTKDQHKLMYADISSILDCDESMK